MESIQILELKDGSIISTPVFLDEKYIVLSPETPFTNVLRNRLLKWGYRALVSETAVVAEAQAADPEPSKAVLEKNEQDVGRKTEAQHAFDSVKAYLKQLFNRLQVRSEISLNTITSHVRVLMEQLKSNREYILSVPPTEGKSSDYLEDHGVRTAVVALAIADQLKYPPPHKQIEVGIAALIHKIGMLKLPSGLHTLNRPLSPQEKRNINATPVIAFKMLKAADFPLPITLAVLEQNERLNGTGYPRQLTEDKISDYGRILAVSTAYSAAVANRPYRDAKDGHSGIMDILKQMGTAYGERETRALVSELSIYPLGTFIVLSNHAKGVVVQTNADTPQHPLIKLLVSEDGSKYMDPPTLQLRAEDPVQIMRPLTKEEIIALNG